MENKPKMVAKGKRRGFCGDIEFEYTREIVELVVKNVKFRGSEKLFDLITKYINENGGFSRNHEYLLGNFYSNNEEYLLSMSISDVVDAMEIYQ